MTVIADEELNRLFQAESQERLAALEAGLLQLEQRPEQPQLIEDLFREAHSLKGAARMLGLTGIQDRAHALEDSFADARDGKAPLTPALIQTQLQSLDQMRGLALEAVGPHGQTTTLPQPEEKPSPARPPEVPPAVSAPAAAGPSPADISPHPPLPAQPESRIETLRVDARKLDYLLSQAGELVVSRGHLQRLQSELDALLERARTQASKSDTESLLENLGNLATRLGEDNARLHLVTSEIESGIRNLRLLPIATLLEPFTRMVHDLAHEQNKVVDFKLAGGDIVVDKRVIEEMRAPLMHLLRNALDHGIEPEADRIGQGKPAVSRIEIHSRSESDHVVLEVSDDGRGLDREAILEQAIKRGLLNRAEAEALDLRGMTDLILQPGFSTARVVTELSGRGVGLDVVRTAIEQLRGTLQIDSTPGKGTRVILTLPISLIASKVLLVEAGGETLALPFEQVSMIRTLHPEDLRQMAGQTYFRHGEDVVPIGQLAWLLGRGGLPDGSEEAAVCVILRVGDNGFGLLVDRLLGEQEVVLKSLPPPLRQPPSVTGVTILDTGNVCAVLNIEGLYQAVARPVRGPARALSTPNGGQPQPKAVLLAEDSITTRIQELRILQEAGYEVVPAVDGLDAWKQLSQRDFDAVVTDIMMPHMDGLELTRRIRGNRKFATLPVILVTSMASEEDRKRGLDAGADVYLCKPEFDQSVLLDCLNRLLG